MAKQNIKIKDLSGMCFFIVVSCLLMSAVAGCKKKHGETSGSKAAGGPRATRPTIMAATDYIGTFVSSDGDEPAFKVGDRIYAISVAPAYCRINPETEEAVATLAIASSTMNLAKESVLLEACGCGPEDPEWKFFKERMDILCSDQVPFNQRMKAAREAADMLTLFFAQQKCKAETGVQAFSEKERQAVLNPTEDNSTVRELSLRRAKFINQDRFRYVLTEEEHKKILEEYKEIFHPTEANSFLLELALCKIDLSDHANWRARNPRAERDLYSALSEVKGKLEEANLPIAEKVAWVNAVKASRAVQELGAPEVVVIGLLKRENPHGEYIVKGAPDPEDSTGKTLVAFSITAKAR